MLCLLGTKQGCCAPCVLLGGPWLHWPGLQTAGLAQQGVAGGWALEGAGGWGGVLGYRCLCFLQSLLPQKPPQSLLRAAPIPPHPQRALPLPPSGQLQHPNPGGAAQTSLGPQSAPTSRCDHRTPNVMGGGSSTMFLPPRQGCT